MRKYKIIVIEDNELHATIIRKSLNSSDNFEFFLSKKLSDIDELIQTIKPDIILTDVKLPDGDSIEYLSKRNIFEILPVIIMSGFGSEKKAVEAIKAGALDYLVKNDVMFLYIPFIAERVIREWSNVKHRKQAEFALKESEERHKIISELISDFIYGVVLDDNGHFHINWISGAFQAITGYNSNDLEFINSDLSSIFIPEKLLELLNNNVYEDAVTISMESKITTKLGLNRFLKYYIKKIFDNKYKFIGLLGAVQDITNQKEYETEQRLLLELKYEAERKQNEAKQIIDNTARLASIGVIAGGITHEINQPLTAIKISADSILYWNKQNQNVLPERVANLLQIISDGSNRIDEIVKHMRTFWLESEKKEIIPVDLNNTILHSVNLLQQKINSHDVMLNIKLADCEINVMADAIQLELVINNLIINSINALDEVEIRNKFINIRTLEYPNYYLLEISDNGCGLPDVNVNSLFDPFYSTGKNKGGTGLGLAIVKMFLDRFDASIDANNNDEGGATFTIEFKK